MKLAVDVQSQFNRGPHGLVVLHIFMLPLPSGLSRRERQLAGYTRTLRNTFPEHSWLSVGPVPAGVRLAGQVRANSIDAPAGAGPTESEISC